MANFFTDDDRCVALWRFEDGALTADSIGTNTLTALGAPAADLADYKEGDASVMLVEASDQYFSIADAALDAGFPLKNGDAVKKLTWCCWVKPTTLSSVWRAILSKADYGLTTSSLGLEHYGTSVRINWGTSADINTGLVLATGGWYHIVVRVDGVAKTLNVNIFKASDSSIQNYNGTPAAELPVTTKGFFIGQYPDKTTTNNFDGRIDEVVVFDDILSDDEIALIRAGTFGVYQGSIPLIFTPQADTYGPHACTGDVTLTFSPDATCGGPHTPYVGYQLLRFTPIADYELFDPGTAFDVDIPASTGGWAMGGAGVIVSTTPSATVIPAIDVATGLPFVSETGLVFGGGTTEVGIAEVTTTYPQADVIVAEEIGFVFCGPEVTGNAATTFPASDVIVAPAAFEFGGAGIITQVAAADIPSAALVGSGGFVLSGSGLTTTPAVTPTATVITPTGGWVFGGRRPDPVEVTYPDDLDRVIVPSGGFEFCGDEGVWESSTPGATVIESAGALFLVGGAGLATSKFPPIALITGDATGGWLLGGTGWAADAEVYEAWCLSGNAFEPSVFSNFGFNSFCVKGGQTYGANENGIYLLGGDYDAGESIESGVRLGPVNFGTAHTKRLRSIVFSQGDSAARVRVRTDEAEAVFSPERDNDRVVVSRDISGPEFTVDLMNFAELGHLEITALKLARR